MTKKSMIKADKITYEYIRRDEEGNVESVIPALDKLSIDVKEGEFITILGANGSGKSTLAKIINRILVAGEGTVYIDGLNAADDENIWKIRQSAGMVFQNPDNQMVSSVVEEDVAFGPENLGVSPEEIENRVYDALCAVGMEKSMKESVNSLSGGEKQRIAIAGILAMNPKCIILDESTSMLDPQARAEVLETVYALNKMNKVTVILITHYMEEALYADKVFVMDRGRIRISGTPKQIFSEEEILEECNLKLPLIVRLANELRNEGLNIPAGILSIDELVDAICQLY